MRRKSFYFMITSIFFCGFMMFSALNAGQVSAKVASISIVTADGSNYEYNYDELKQSAVSNALGDTAGAALYQHFLKNKVSIKNFYDDSRNVYVPYSAVVNEAISEKLKGVIFYIDSFVENQSTPTESAVTTKFTSSAGTVVQVDSYGFDLYNIN